MKEYIENIKHHTEKEMLNKTIEEIQELKVEVVRLKAFKKRFICNLNEIPQELLEKVIEETADVYNMLNQLCIMLNIESEVQQVMKMKMERQIKRNNQEKCIVYDNGDYNE